MDEQQKQAKALATLRVDGPLERLSAMLMSIHGMASHISWGRRDADGREMGAWAPHSLLRVAKEPMDWVDANIEEAAVVAFPEYISDISGVLRSARKLKTIAEDYKREPWIREPTPPEGWDKRNTPMNEQMNVLMKHMERLHHIIPSNRN